MGLDQEQSQRGPMQRGAICFKMELHPEQVTAQSRRLVLHANFRLEEFRMAVGSLLVGITGGRLQLRFVNGQFATTLNGERKRALRVPAPVSRDTSALNVHLSAQSSAETPVNTGEEFRGVYRYGVEELNAHLHCTSEVYLSSGGGARAPYWDFDSRHSKALRGDCLNEVLGEFSIDDLTQCGEVHAEFIAPPRALWISGSDEVWPARMGPNQRIVRRLLIWRWLRPRVRARVHIVA